MDIIIHCPLNWQERDYSSTTQRQVYGERDFTKYHMFLDCNLCWSWNNFPIQSDL